MRCITLQRENNYEGHKGREGFQILQRFVFFVVPSSSWGNANRQPSTAGCSSPSVELSPEAMHDPNPKRSCMGIIRWLLLLSPSALLIGTPLIGDLLDSSPISDSGKFFRTLSFFNLPLAGILCFVLGFCLEYWLRGKINSVVWALNYGFMIFFVNSGAVVLLATGFR